VSHHHPHAIPDWRGNLAVLTVSDTRTADDDGSGKAILEMIAQERHYRFDYKILPDDPDQVRRQVMSWVQNDKCDAVLINGGTGIAPRDTTYEAIASLIERRLDGFGELFRALSWEEIGSRAMLSRAVAGIASGTMVFSMPGSTPAVKLAMEKLILPQLAHLAGELRKP
jgi:molybdenum cofactor biosynthesis protein B